MNTDPNLVAKIAVGERFKAFNQVNPGVYKAWRHREIENAELDNIEAECRRLNIGFSGKLLAGQEVNQPAWQYSSINVRMPD